jgi:hypothetical protein
MYYIALIMMQPQGQLRFMGFRGFFHGNIGVAGFAGVHHSL